MHQNSNKLSLLFISIFICWNILMYFFSNDFYSMFRTYLYYDLGINRVLFHHFLFFLLLIINVFIFKSKINFKWKYYAIVLFVKLALDLVFLIHDYSISIKNDSSFMYFLFNHLGIENVTKVILGDFLIITIVFLTFKYLFLKKTS